MLSKAVYCGTKRNINSKSITYDVIFRKLFDFFEFELSV